MKAAIFLLLLTFPVVGAANRFPDVPSGDFAFGPSLAYVGTKGSNGVGVNADLSYSKTLFSLSVNGKYAQIDDRHHWGLSFEGTVWLVANIGGGVGFLGGDGTHPLVNLFVGLPLGDRIRMGGPFKGAFIEPYYRVNWWNGRVFHEAGIFIKVTTFGFR